MTEYKKINIKNVIKRLNTKWSNRPCPMCDENSWTISNTLYELRKFHCGNLILGGGPIAPIIPVICNNCGNTIIVNALQSGAIEK